MKIPQKVEREHIHFILSPRFVLFIFCALISLPGGKRLKAEVEKEVGNFGVYCCKPNKLYVLTASNLVDGLLYSDRLNVVLAAVSSPEIFFLTKQKIKSIR